LSEEFMVKAGGGKGSEAYFLYGENLVCRQRSHRASLGDRAGYLDRLLTSLAGKSGHNPFDFQTLKRYDGYRLAHIIAAVSL